MATVMEPTEELARFKREQERLREAGVEYCLAAYVDVHGIAKCKAVPIDHFVTMMQGSELFTGAALDGLGQEPSDDELSVRPDLDAITVLPWEPTVAWAPGQLLLPRRPVADGLADRSATPAGSRRRPRASRSTSGSRPSSSSSSGRTGRSSPANPKDTLAKAAYDIVGLLENMSYMDELVKYMNVLGWDVHSFDHEDANSQFEFDFSYTDALGDGRPPDAVAHDDQDARAQARLRGHVHAQAVRRPDRQRRSLQHVAGGSQHRGEPVRRSRRSAGVRRLNARLPVHRRGPPPRAGDLRDHRLYRQLVQAADQDRLDDRDSPGRRCTCPTGTTTGRTCCGFR